MESRDFWNAEARTFDEAADHGLRDPLVRQAWRDLLGRLVPDRCRVLDVGCGTGSLSLLLAEAGHQVTGIDFAPAMIEQAMAKAASAGLAVDFSVGDAADPGFAAQSFDVVLGRHILWAITAVSTRNVLERWSNLVSTTGRLVMIEGFWHTGAGLRKTEILSAIPPELEVVLDEDLARHTSLWGAPVSDERYVVVTRKFD